MATAWDVSGSMTGSPICEPVYDVHVARTDHVDALGPADLVDCGTVKTAPVADTVHLDAVRGVDPTVAVFVRSGGWHGLYVVEGLKRSSWPRALVRVVYACVADHERIPTDDVGPTSAHRLLVSVDHSRAHG